MLALSACATKTTTGASLTKYCDSVLAAETKPIAETGGDSQTDKEKLAMVKTSLTEEIRPLADKIVAAAPEEVAPHVAVMAKALGEVEKSGDVAALGKPAVLKAQKAAHAFDLENCEWNEQSVTATEFAFEGMPSSLDSGTVSFELENTGTEIHDMSIFRKQEGTTKPLLEILALPEADAEKELTFVTSQSAQPGESAYVIAELPPGDYALVCFLPSGSKPNLIEVAQKAKRGLVGIPHYLQGMTAEFTV